MSQTDPYPSDPVLMVDDDVRLLRSLDNILRNEGISNTIRCADSRKVEAIITAHEVELVLLDLSMPHIGGQDILSIINGKRPDVPVIIVTATQDIVTAVSCVKRGAFDYMVKPVDHNRLIAGVSKAIEFRELRRENAKLKRLFQAGQPERPEVFDKIITSDETMISIFKYVEMVAASSQTVFITGETGTGKELIAKAVHRASGRTGEFVCVNVAGLDDTMFSDTLFGHKKGAFTGATEARDGLIESAIGGTLFLDEIGDLSIASQVKLLRFLQDGEYLALGADVPRASDARLVVATNRDVRRLLGAGKFREDLYFRLLAHHVHLPPLRERRNDLPLLVDHFLDEAAHALDKNRPTPPKELILHLSTYRFPGNVRELQAMVHDAVGRHVSGTLSLSSFKAHMDDDPFRGSTPPAASWEPAAISGQELPTLKEATTRLVKEALRKTANNKSAAARLLGISRQTMRRYCRALRTPGEPA